MCTQGGRHAVHRPAAVPAEQAELERRHTPRVKTQTTRRKLVPGVRGAKCLQSAAVAENIAALEAATAAAAEELGAAREASASKLRAASDARSRRSR